MKGTTMKTKLAVMSCLSALLVATATVLAVPAVEPVTITGEGKCAKCALKAAEQCQNVIEARKDGKPVTYFLVENEVSKGFHGKLCKESRSVTATGTVKELDGKLYLTATKLNLAG
jgi:hypothetical protein